MNLAAVTQTDPQARIEAWMWLLIVVGVFIGMLLVIGIVRRRLIRPMAHTPSDTADAWTEAGRRLPVPPADAKGGAAPDDEASP